MAVAAEAKGLSAEAAAAASAAVGAEAAVEGEAEIERLAGELEHRAESHATLMRGLTALQDAAAMPGRLLLSDGPAGVESGE